MKTLMRQLLCGAVLIGCAATALARDQRPTVGLVLSGGGARGAAHIGVLRVLEELRVPVDVVAGTSMGAVIGGLYAAGADVDQLTALVERIDWRDSFRDDPDRSRLSYRRKQDEGDFLIDYDIGIGPQGVKLPRGLVQGQNLNMLLRAQTLAVAHIDDFDALPIAFRAVATDIETGEAVTLGTGSLATALRASMAVPAVFAPVQHEGRLLVDGGVSNNLPVDVARAMGAEVLIVVDIQFPLLPREQLNSALDITEQLLTILVIRESRTQLSTLGTDDIVIVPELGMMGSTDFSLTASAVLQGEASARAQSAALEQLRLPEVDYARYAEARRHPPREPRIDYVRAGGSAVLAEDALAARLDLGPGLLDLERLERRIARLYGLGNFELVDYALETDGLRNGLSVTATDKSWGPDYVKLGARLVDDLDGTSRYTLGLRYTRTAINALGAEWRSDLQIGSNPRLYSEFYQPLVKDWRYFIAPQVELERFDADLFEGQRRTAELLVSTARAGIDFGRTLGNRGEIRIGLQRITGRISRRIGTADFEPERFDSGGFTATLSHDTLDNVDFPTRGWKAFVTWQGSRERLGATQANDRIEVSSIWAGSSGRQTWLLAQRLGTNLRGRGAVQDLFELGGLFRLSGLRNGQLRGQHYAVLDLVHYRRLGSPATFATPIYAGASLEVGGAWNDSSAVSAANSILAGSLYVGIDTLVGPVYLALGLAEGGQSAAYFLLGRGFR